MNKSFDFHSRLIIIGVPAFIVLMMVVLAKSSIFLTNSNTLSFGISFDLLITLPLVYFFLIRKTNIPNTTVVPLLILAMVICSTILPTQNQAYLNLFKTWILPIVELTIVSYIIYNLTKAIKNFRKERIEEIDFYTALKITCKKIIPKGFVIPFVTEIAVFYYGFIHWKSRKLNEFEFTYHKESGTIPLLVVLIFIVFAETAVLHLLIQKWSVIAAWILSFLSIYSGIQLFGFLKSMYKRPISIRNGTLYLRYGIMNETTIPLASIQSIDISSKDINLNKETRKLSILGELESHNVIINLKHENELEGLYGVKRKYRTLALHVDEKKEFVDFINKSLDKK